MYRKITLTLTVLIAFLFVIFPKQTVASEPKNNGSTEISEPAETMTGYLTDEEGNVQEVIGQLIETPDTGLYAKVPVISSFNYDGSEVQASTYEYTLYASSTGTLSTSGSDSKKAVKATLSIYWDQKNTTPKEYKLTKVMGTWTHLISSISVKKATLTYGSSGFSPTPHTQSKTRDITKIAGWNYSTGFTKYTTGVQGVMGTNVVFNLSSGGTNYSFTLSNNRL